MADQALDWLDDPAKRAAASRRLADLRDRVAVPGASARAAERVVEVAGGNAPYRGPHPRREESRRPS